MQGGVETVKSVKDDKIIVAFVDFVAAFLLILKQFGFCFNVSKLLRMRRLRDCDAICTLLVRCQNFDLSRG